MLLSHPDGIVLVCRVCVFVIDALWCTALKNITPM